jgi:hypothetical protein
MTARQLILLTTISVAASALLPSAHAADAATSTSHIYVCTLQGSPVYTVSFGGATDAMIVSKVFTHTGSESTVTALWQAWLGKHWPSSSLRAGYGPENAPHGGCKIHRTVSDAEETRAYALTSGPAMDWPPPSQWVQIIPSNLIAKYWGCGTAVINGSQIVARLVTPVFEVPFVVKSEDVARHFHDYVRAQHPDPAETISSADCMGYTKIAAAQKHVDQYAGATQLSWDYSEFKLGGPNAK